MKKKLIYIIIYTIFTFVIYILINHGDGSITYDCIKTGETVEVKFKKDDYYAIISYDEVLVKKLVNNREELPGKTKKEKSEFIRSILDEYCLED